MGRSTQIGVVSLKNAIYTQLESETPKSRAFKLALKVEA